MFTWDVVHLGSKGFLKTLFVRNCKARGKIFGVHYALVDLLSFYATKKGGI